jgi:hypothetical protein
MPDIGDIYEAMWHGSKPYQLPGPWQRFRSHDSVRRLPAEAISELRKCFPEGDLHRAGVLRLGGQLSVVHPALAASTAPVLFVRAASGSITQVIASMCAIGRHMGALPALLTDACLRQLLADSETGIVLVSSMVDLAILWALSIPAAPATGLARLSGKPLQHIVGQLDLTCLTLSDCCLERLQRGHSPYLGTVERHLTLLERHLPIQVYRKWWTPTQERLENLAFALSQGIDAHVGDAVYDSIVTGDPLPRAEWSTARAVPTTIHEALAAWQDDRDRQRNAQPAWADLQCLLHREFGEGLLRQASQLSDPRARCQLTAAAAVVPLVLSELFAMFGQVSLAQKEWRGNRTMLTSGQLERIDELMTLLQAQLGGRHGPLL